MEKRQEIALDLKCKFFQRNAIQFRGKIVNRRNICGVIERFALSIVQNVALPVRRQGHVRGICFEQNAVKRDGAEDVSLA